MKEQQGIPASKLWTRDFVLLTVSNLFLYLNLQMITPALPAYVTERFGAGQWTVSLVISLFALAAIVTRIFAGAWLKRGRTALILLLGLTVYMLATASYYAAGTLALFLLIRILYGIGFGVSSTAFGTLVSDIIPIRRMGEGMGYFGLSTSLSMSAAPVIGLWLLGSYGIGTLILVSSLLAILIIPLSLLIRSTPAAPKPASAPSPAAAPDTRGTYKQVALPCFLNMLLSITYGGLISYLALFGKEVHIGNVGWFFLCNAGAVLLVRPVAGKIFDKKGHIAVLPPGRAHGGRRTRPAVVYIQHGRTSCLGVMLRHRLRHFAAFAASLDREAGKSGNARYGERNVLQLDRSRDRARLPASGRHRFGDKLFHDVSAVGAGDASVSGHLRLGYAGQRQTPGRCAAQIMDYCGHLQKRIAFLFGQQPGGQSFFFSCLPVSQECSWAVVVKRIEPSSLPSSAFQPVASPRTPIGTMTRPSCMTVGASPADFTLPLTSA